MTLPVMPILEELLADPEILFAIKAMIHPSQLFEYSTQHLKTLEMVLHQDEELLQEGTCNAFLSY